MGMGALVVILLPAEVVVGFAMFTTPYGMGM
jgi:hypothetical protein